MFSLITYIHILNVGNCPHCGGNNTMDNGDNNYCYDCNAIF